MSVKVQLGSVRDIVAALESPDVGLRMAVHRALASAPEKALGYGREWVDVLLAQGAEGESSSALMACVTLSAVPDPRVGEFFLDRLERGRGEVLTAAAAYLLAHPFERARAYSALLSNDSLRRARCVARVLGWPRPEDPPPVALRLAILHPDCSLPPRSGVWAPLWEAELEGVCAQDARAGLGSDQTTPDEEEPVRYPPQAELLAALENPDWRVRARASDGLIALGAAEPVKALVQDERLGVRAAAVQILMALGEHEWLEKSLLAP